MQRSVPPEDLNEKVFLLVGKFSHIKINHNGFIFEAPCCIFAFVPLSTNIFLVYSVFLIKQHKKIIGLKTTTKGHLKFFHQKICSNYRL